MGMLKTMQSTRHRQCRSPFTRDVALQAPGGEMPGTGGFIGKARLEGGAGHGAVIFPAAGHDGTLHEHAADAHQKLNISSNRAQRDKPLL